MYLGTVTLHLSEFEAADLAAAHARISGLLDLIADALPSPIWDAVEFETAEVAR